MHIEIPTEALKHFNREVSHVPAEPDTTAIIVMLEEPIDSGGWAVGMIQPFKDHEPLIVAYDCDTPGPTPVSDSILAEITDACRFQGVDWMGALNMPTISTQDTGSQTDRHERFSRIADVYKLEVEPAVAPSTLLPRFVSVRMTLGAFNREVPRSPANLDYRFSQSFDTKEEEQAEFMIDLGDEIWDGWMPWATFDLDAGRLLNVYYPNPKIYEDGPAEVIDVLDPKDTSGISADDLAKAVIQ